MIATRSLVPARQEQAPLPGWLWLLPILLFPVGIFGPNVLLGSYACLVLAIGLRLLWREEEPPILVFVFVYQWMQSATGVLYGNLLGIPIEDLPTASGTWISGRHEFASALMLTGTLVLALAIRAAAGNRINGLHLRMKALVGSRSFGFWLRIYLVAYLFSLICVALAQTVGGLRIPLLTLANVKWAAFVLLTFSTFTSSARSTKKLWFLVFGFEFIMSLGGYFANFKDVFFYALFGLVASNVRVGGRTLLVGSLLGFCLIFLAVTWTAIKPEYRFFVNYGSRQQVIIADYSERMGYMLQLVGNLNREKMEFAAQKMSKRLIYHYFFGAAAAHVPNVVPYSGGQIWGEAVTRPFMPRLFFPNKSVVDDSDLTRKYSGVFVAGADEGTSISLGYMAEAYIDFGPFGMFAAIAALGVGLGSLYRWLLRQRGAKVVIGWALAPVAIMPAHLAETSILKMIPTLIMSWLVCIFVLKLLAPIILNSANSRRVSA